MIVSQRIAEIFREYGFITLERLTKWLVCKRKNLPSTQHILKILSSNPTHYSSKVAHAVLPYGWHWRESSNGKWEKFYSPDTFGDTNIEAAGNSNADYIFGNKATCPGSGTGTSISWYLGSAGTNYKYALYKNSDRSLVGSCPQTASIADWTTINFAANPALTAQDYIITSNQAAAGNRYHKTAGVPASYAIVTGGTYADFPPATCSVPDTAWEFSAYCTYTPAGGVTVKKSGGLVSSMMAMLNSRMLYSRKDFQKNIPFTPRCVI